MAAPTALDSIRTGTPDGTSGIKIPTILTQEDSTLEAPVGIAMSDRIASGGSPERPTFTVEDTATDMSTVDFAGTSGANLTAINNRGAIVIWATFEGVSDSVSIRTVYYTENDVPIFVGPVLTFTPLAGHRQSAAGRYLTSPQMVETYGASKFRNYIVAKSTADDISIFAVPI